MPWRQAATSERATGTPGSRLWWPLGWRGWLVAQTCHPGRRNPPPGQTGHRGCPRGEGAERRRRAAWPRCTDPPCPSAGRPCTRRGGTCPLAAQSWAATAPAPEGNEAGPGRHRRCPWRRLVVEGPGQTPRPAADEGTGQGQRLRRGPAELRDVTPYGLHLWGSRCNEPQLRFKINHV